LTPPVGQAMKDAIPLLTGQSSLEDTTYASFITINFKIIPMNKTH
jgi:hypothetical protein